MAHFAKIGSNSKVIQVLTLNNDDMLNADGVEDETVGQQYLEQHNASASWKSPIGDAPELTTEQTSQNEAATHAWYYEWNESTTTWDLTDTKA